MASTDAFGGGMRVITLVFDVIRIDFPPGQLRHSRKIWNHVDEMRLEPELAVRLARNGLRVGAASPAAWPAITAIIEAAGAEVRREQLVAEQNLPLSIKLSTIGAPESIFRYNRSGRLVGKTFPEGEKLLNIGYSLHPRMGACTDLEMMFEIRRDRGVMTWERQGGIIRQMPAVDRELFDDLVVLMTLNTEEFLVIGVNQQVAQEQVFGHRILSVRRGGRMFETMLCIAPRPFQTARKGSAK